MKISVLEFSIKDNLFGIKTEYVKNIFDVENYKPVPLMPDYVVGLTTHGKYIYPLICMEKLLEIGSNCNKVIGKTAITIDIEGSLYSLLVDEIHKIQEIEKSNDENYVINFYNLRGIILEEVTPLFLKRKIKIPPVKQKTAISMFNDNNNLKRENEENFLIFSCGNRVIGLNTDFIKKVENLENLKKSEVKDDVWIEGVYLVRDIPIKAGSINKLLGINDSSGEFLIIIEKNKKNFGLIVDDIIDIISIKESMVNKGINENIILKDFIVYNKDVIPILSDKFIENSIEKFSLSASEQNFDKNHSVKNNQLEFLIVSIGKEQLGIKMENIEEIFEYRDLHISNYPTKNKAVKGLIATKKESLFLVSFDEFLGDKINIEADNTKILIIKEDKLKVALLISDIVDIISVSEESYAEFKEDNLFIKGAFFDKKGNLINVINLKWIFHNFNEEKTVSE